MTSVFPTDEALFELVIVKDVDALENLYDRYAPQVFNLIKRIVKDHTVAEGLLQETFFQVWEKSSTYTYSGSIAAWICRIARNKGLDYLRRNTVRPQVIYKAIDELYDLTDGDSAKSPEIYVEQQVRHEHLQSALLQLPLAQETCIRLAFFEGMTHTEISERTTIPLGTVKTRIRSGLSKLALLLQNYGYYDYKYVS